MLKSAIDDEDSTVDDKGEGQEHDKPVNGAAAARPPTRPRSAPPARGRRPQPNVGNNESNQQTSAPSAAASAMAGGNVTNGGGGAGVDGDSFGKDSHDLQGFDELEGEAGALFSYDDYPAAGSPEEPEWLHTPWCGTNSGDIPVLDKNFEKAAVGGNAPAVSPLVPRLSMSAPSASSRRDARGKSADGGICSGFDEHGGTWGGSAQVEDITSSTPPRREGQHPDGGDVKPGVTIELLPVARGAEEKGAVAAVSPLSLAGDEEKEEGKGNDRASPRRPSGAVSSPRVVAGGGELKRYDWGGADVFPTKPSLAATSRIPTGNRAEKQKIRNARRRDANKKVGQARIVVPMDKHSRAIGLVSVCGPCSRSESPCRPARATYPYISPDLTRV